MSSRNVGSRATVAVVTLGCGRNEVDSDQVLGALTQAGFALSDDPSAADCVLVNTCTFIEAARSESIETILGACDARQPEAAVVVMGCMAERYGQQLQESLPEVAAVVGFDAYPRLPQIVSAAVAGDPIPTAEKPARSLPLLGNSDPRPPARWRSPSPSPSGSPTPGGPPTAAFPVRTVPRGPWAYLKIAGGCDRSCTFCTIPSYRGSFVSRPADEIIAEARWLADGGVGELVCVSENTTSWGKDLPSGRDGQAALVHAFEDVDGLKRVRLLYLQPAELRPALLDAMAASPVVASYYDLSLQHASPAVLAGMARSGGADRFLELIAGIRARDPDAVFRSSFIVGFPGETEDDVEILEEFLTAAELDWMGFFTYSREEGTRSAAMPGQVDAAEARRRRDHLMSVAELVADDCASRFVGRELDVLMERIEDGVAYGRSHREAPDVDGEIRLTGAAPAVGEFARVVVTETDGVDLAGRVVERGRVPTA